MAALRIRVHGSLLCLSQFVERSYKAIFKPAWTRVIITFAVCGILHDHVMPCVNDRAQRAELIDRPISRPSVVTSRGTGVLTVAQEC